MEYQKPKQLNFFIEKQADSLLVCGDKKDYRNVKNRRQRLDAYYCF